MNESPDLTRMRTQLAELRCEIDRLHLERDRFERIFEHAPIALASFDLAASKTVLNAAARELLLGPEGQDLETILDSTHPDDRALDAACWSQVLSGESDGYVLPKRFKRPDGSYQWCRLSVAIQRGPPSAIAVSAVQDIDGPMRRLNEQDDLLDNLPIGLLVCRLEDGRVRYANEYLVQLLGENPGELQQRTASQLFSDQRPLPILQKLLEEGGQQRIWLQGADDRPIEVDARTKAIEFSGDACMAIAFVPAGQG